MVGVGLTAVLLLPTVLAVIQNPRIDNPPQGWGALLYGNEQRYVHILQCLFFPPDIPARPNFTPDSNAKWASLGAWLPLFSMSGVIAWLQTQKRDWLKRLLIILFFMAMVPILNSAFQLFNSSYYARWFYMLTLMMSLATVRSLESVDVYKRQPLNPAVHNSFHQAGFLPLGDTVNLTALDIHMIVAILPVKGKLRQHLHLSGDVDKRQAKSTSDRYSWGRFLSFSRSFSFVSDWLDLASFFGTGRIRSLISSFQTHSRSPAAIFSPIWIRP